MIEFVILYRTVDGLVLTESCNCNQSEIYVQRNEAKLVLSEVSNSSETMGSIRTGPYNLNYLVENGVCYMCLVNHSYSTKLSFSFLKELSTSFFRQYGSSISSAVRPYSFMSFDPSLQRIRKTYTDTRSTQNLARLNQDLNEVTRIMTRNMQDVIGRGESLDRMSSYSKELSEQSRSYLNKSKKLNIAAIYKKYGPAVVVILTVLLLFYIKSKFF